MPWDLPTGALVQGGLAVYNQREKIREVAEKLVSFITKGTLRITVFGPGGVGKSTLGGFLAAGDPNAIRPILYKPSDRLERTPLRGPFVGGLVIAPGQEALYPEDWEALFDYLRDGKARMVINVVAWGYHSFEKLAYQDVKTYQPGMSPSQFLAAYLQECRAREEAVLAKLEPYLLTAKRNLRMLTLITKQDLWWDQRAAVRQHYETGAYGQAIQRIEQQRGKGFIHDYVPVSLVMSNFMDGRGEILEPTTQGYDQMLQQAWQETLIRIARSFARR
jgi:hypothetical protein